MDYKEIVNIDLSGLEIECINQARNYYIVSEKLANANKEFDTMCLQLKSKRAEVAITYRDSQVKKPTANDIENYVNNHQDVIYLESQKIGAEYAKNMLFGLLRSLDNKRDMLKILSWSNRGNNNDFNS